jgi:hypothetical protein
MERREWKDGTEEGSPLLSQLINLLLEDAETYDDLVI